jgi:hypothetical protein
VNPRNLAQLLGRRGGRARARRLTAEERRRIASSGGHARRESLEAAMRIAATLRHAQMVAQLQQRSGAIARVKRCRGPLPGIYRQPQIDE